MENKISSLTFNNKVSKGDKQSSKKLKSENS